MKVAVVTPVGPGHEHLVGRAKAPAPFIVIDNISSGAVGRHGWQTDDMGERHRTWRNACREILAYWYHRGRKPLTEKERAVKDYWRDDS